MYRRNAILAAPLLISLFILHSSDFARAQCTFGRAISNPAASQLDFFGNSIAISGNGIAVGAYVDDAEAPNGGTAYVFFADSGGMVSRLINPDPDQNDWFGYAIGISGNLVVVGAHRDNGGGPGQSGIAYVFNATTGAVVATLNNPSPSLADSFGFSVAISGNVAVVGVPMDDSSGTNSGQAVVLNATTGALLTPLSNPTPGGNDEFGHAVAISGDIIVVGAPQDDTSAQDSGAVHVFSVTTGGFVRTLLHPSPSQFAFFGSSVAVSGSVIVVGAPYDDSDVGTAHVFDATTGDLIATLNNPDPEAGVLFGRSVGTDGNVAVVGSFSDDFETTDLGRAFTYDAATGELVTPLLSSSASEADGFGFAVAASGGIVVVGASQDETGAPLAGRAFTYTCAVPPPGRGRGDFDSSGCTDLSDFLFLIDNWQLAVEGTPIGVDDFLNLLDNWQMGPECP